jgi:hypothetical protein
MCAYCAAGSYYSLVCAIVLIHVLLIDMPRAVRARIAGAFRIEQQQTVVYRGANKASATCTYRAIEACLIII